MPAPVILAIEASQRTGGVAVQDPGGACHTEMFAGHLRHDDDLLPAIDRLMTRVGLEPKQLEVVGVSVGPGGFTGLRIAVSTAKMFAEVLGSAIVAVPSAYVAAQGYRRRHDGSGPIIVALASKRDAVWATTLRWSDAGWAPMQPPAPADAQGLSLHGVEALLGDEHLPETVRARCVRESVAVIEPCFDPADCLSVARGMHEADAHCSALALAPLYARQPEAVSLWERRHDPSSDKHNAN